MLDFTNLIAEAKSSDDIIDTLARTPLSQVLIFVAALTVVRLALGPVLLKTPAHRRFGLYKLSRILNEFLDAVIYAGVFVFMVIRPFGIQAFRIPSGSMWPTLYVGDYIVANKAIYRYSEPKPGDIVVFRPPVEATLGHPEQVQDGQVKVDFIKRCVGAPGDIVELRAGVLYRNGQAVEDATKHYSNCADEPGSMGECQNFREFTDETKAKMIKPSFKLVKDGNRYVPLNYTDTEANMPFPTQDFETGSAIYSLHPNFNSKDAADAMRLKSLPAAPLPPGYFLMMGDNRNNSFDSRGWGMVPRESIVARGEVIWLPISRMRRVH